MRLSSLILRIANCCAEYELLRLAASTKQAHTENFVAEESVAPVTWASRYRLGRQAEIGQQLS